MRRLGVPENFMLSSIRRYLPDPLNIDARERARSLIGAMLGLFVMGALSQLAVGAGSPLPWLIAPMGASAVLLFAVPASPLAQPWSVFGGNVASALVGVACAKLIGVPLVAGGVAVATAIGVMFLLRCIHPPGGAVALSVALGGPLVAQQGFAFALSPVALNSLLLIAVAIAYNKLCGRRYPHHAHFAVDNASSHHTADPLPLERLGVTTADLDAVLQQYNQVLDISRDDLEEILLRTEMHAHQRRFGEVKCGDIMSRDVVKVEFGTELQPAWRLFSEHHIHALPVVNRFNRVIGILTQRDFIRQCEFEKAGGIPQKLRRLLKRTPETHSDKPEVVGQIMTSNVQTAAIDQAIVSLIPMFADTDLHHLPVVDANQRLVGIVTQSDLVAALYNARLHPERTPVGNAEGVLRRAV
jgi:CBS domain-containing membrane protein